MASARKIKARLTKNNLAKLKAKNKDLVTEQEQSLSLTEDELQRVGDELVRSTVEGFEKELSNSSPALQQIAKRFAGMIQEFFVGFKEGVNAELKQFVKDSGKVVSGSVATVEKAVVTNVEALNQKLEDIVPPEKEEPKVKEEKKDVISSILGRDKADKSILQKDTGFNLKDFLTQVALGSVGMEDVGERIVENRQQKEQFIKTESVLRQDQYEGMSEKEIRTQLEKDYETIQRTTEQLRDIEKQISSYKEMGYSEKQIEKLGVGAEKTTILRELAAADPSRVQIPELELGKDTKQPQQLSAPITEEDKQEEIARQEKQTDEAEKQTTLLNEIRDILKTQQGASGASAAQPESGGVELPDLSRVRLPKFGGIAKGIARGASTIARGAGNLLKGGVQVANAPLSGAAKVAAPLAAGLAVGEGVMDLAEGKKVEEIGQVVPEGWSKLNPFSWAMRGGMYVGEKLNKGYGAVSEKLSGSGSLGGDIFEGVQKVKGIFSGTPTIEDVKKTTSDLADKGMNAVFGTKAERVARQADRAMLEAPDALADAVGLKELADETKRDKYIEKWKKDGGYNKLSEKEKVDFDEMVTQDFSLENSKKKLEELEKSKLDISQSQSNGNNALGFVQSIQNTKNLSEEDKKKALGSLEAQYTGLEFGDVKDAVKRMVTPGAGGLFSGITNKAKSLFGFGSPTVEQKTAANGSTLAPATTVKVETQAPTQNLTDLEKQRAKIAAMEQPGESAAVKMGREKVLAALDRKIEKEKANSGAPVNYAKEAPVAASGEFKSTATATPPTTTLARTAGDSWAPISPTSTATNKSAKDNKVKEAAAKLGITGEVRGVFEAEILTSIIDASGKKYPIEVTGKDKQTLEAVRNIKAGNTSSANLEETAISKENAVPRQIPQSVKETAPDISSRQNAAEIGKNIVVQAPPPVVIPSGGGGGEKVVMPPFTGNIRNRESTISSYLKARYLPT